jgi:hypothetical protein
MLACGFQFHGGLFAPPQPTEGTRGEHRKLRASPIDPALAEQRSGGLDSGESRLDPRRLPASRFSADDASRISRTPPSLPRRRRTSARL